MNRRTMSEVLLVLLGFTALTCLVLQPLPWNLGRLVYGAENGDAQFSVWNVGWVARTL